MDENQSKALRALPQLDALLNSEKCVEYIQLYSYNCFKAALKSAIHSARKYILSNNTNISIDEILMKAQSLCVTLASPRRVINATGIALHTNLGRAPLSEKAREAVLSACGYTDLEYSLDTASRSNRGAIAERLICELTFAQAALCVNNNAAALLLALTVMPCGKAGVISRGELVEIGGSFRIADIMQASGAAIMEIGSTNRTHEQDYVRACESKGAGAVLKIHTSNYKIDGFSKELSTKSVCDIAHKYGLPVLVDLGSGAIMDEKEYPFTEPCVPQTLRDGADIVCFSGDKLLGGAQCGILCGSSEWIEKMRSHPLARALRPDKLCIAALSATLSDYASPELARQNIPVLRMVCESEESSRENAIRLVNSLNEYGVSAEIIKVNRPVGGGSVPTYESIGYAAAIAHKSPQELCKALLKTEIPVVAFVRAQSIVLDPLCFIGDDMELAAKAVSLLL